MQCQEMIEAFLYSEQPSATASKAVRFEAISAEILSTKQRRYGPVQSPETQVAVRNVIRHHLDAGTPIDIFVPFGCCKADQGPVDILEFMALRQLVTLQDSLARMGVDTTFHFRLDDLTDRYLFGDSRITDIEDYAWTLEHLIGNMLASKRIVKESLTVTWSRFANLADEYTPIFYRYMTGYSGVESLKAIGWAGDIPREQREHYMKANKHLTHDAAMHQVARYFAWTLARKELQVGMAPPNSIQVSFARPIPGAPPTGARIWYRTLPERFTGNHVPPWNAYGYMEIRGRSCTPKIVPEEGMTLDANITDWNGIPISTPYVIVE